MNNNKVLDTVPESVSGDVIGKIEQCKMVTRRDGTQNLRVDMVVTQDGSQWYKMTSWIPSDPTKAWIKKQFWASLGYTGEQMASMTLRDDCAPWCTYLTLCIHHSGPYVNVKRYNKKIKNNFIPTPWHVPSDEKFGGKPYLQPTANPAPTAQPAPETPTTAVSAPASAPVTTPATEAETKPATPATEPMMVRRIDSPSETKPQKIDLSWVITENLIAELTRRGFVVSDPDYDALANQLDIDLDFA